MMTQAPCRSDRIPALVLLIAIIAMVPVTGLLSVPTPPATLPHYGSAQSTVSSTSHGGSTPSSGAYVPYGPTPRPGLPLDLWDGGHSTVTAQSVRSGRTDSGGSFILFANASRPSGPIPLTVGFTPIATPGDAISPPDSYTVSYGDGNGASGTWDGCDPARTSTYVSCPAFEHTYTTPGTYTVDIRITNSSGATGTATTTVTAFASSETASWTNLTGRTGGAAPSPRTGAAVAYDPVAQEVVLFGGWDGAYLGDTWTFQDGVWTNITSSLSRSPSPRYGALMAWDASSSEIVMVGGMNDTSGYDEGNDTWTFSGSAWTPAAQAPAYLDGNNEMSNDTQLGGIVLTGMMSDSPLGVGTAARTLQFVGGRWSLVTMSDPGAQWDPEANDATDGYVLSLGGNGSYAGFALAGESWETLKLGTEPTWDGYQTMVDEYGGDDASTSGTEVLLELEPWSYPVGVPEEWSYFGGSWTNLTSLTSPVSSPTLRYGPSIVYDPAAQGVLVFGGEKTSGAFWGDTWTYTLPASFQSTLAVQPINTTPDHGAVTFQTTTVGGDGLLTYQYTGLPPGCTSQDMATISCTPTAAGTYTPEVWVNDSDGGQAPPSQATLYVAGSLFVSAAGTPTSGGDPLTVSFSASAAGTAPYTWSWNFGDGSATSSYADPTHEYNQTGAFTAVLTVTDALGDTAQADVTIQVGSPSLFATAVVTPTNGTVPLLVDCNGTANGGTAPYSYTWDFDDGSAYSQAENPIHQFNTSGAFDVNFTVRDATGQVAWETVLVTVSNSNATLSAVVYATPTAGPAPLLVDFQGGGLGGEAPYTYFWDFGDGSDSSSQDPSHTYSAGTYQGELQVTDARGATALAVFSVTATSGTSALAVDPSATPDGGSAPLNVSFDANPSGGSGGYVASWNFGDGSVATDWLDPYHVYSTAGTFSVLVTVTDSDGDTANATLTMTVADGCTSCSLTLSANYAPSNVEVGTEVTFWANTTGGVAPYVASWDFGDGSTGTGTVAYHAYEAVGDYTVSVEVFDSDGHEALGSLTVDVVACSGSCTPPLLLSLSPSPPQGASPLLVALDANLSGGTAPYALTFCFGDGSTCLTAEASASGIEAAVHTYELPGTYTPYVEVTDAHGANASASTQVRVTGSAPLSVSAAALPTTGSAPLNVSFWANVTGGSGPYTLQWYFGDGQAGSGVPGSPTYHVYSSAGTYRPWLLVTDGSGVTINTSMPEITVSSPATHPAPATIPGTTLLAAGVLSGAIGVAVAGFAAVALRKRRREWQVEGKDLVSAMEHDLRPPAPPTGPSPPPGSP